LRSQPRCEAGRNGVLPGVRRGGATQQSPRIWASPKGLGAFGLRLRGFRQRKRNHFALRLRRSSLAYRRGYASLLAPRLAPKSSQPTHGDLSSGVLVPGAAGFPAPATLITGGSRYRPAVHELPWQVPGRVPEYELVRRFAGGEGRDRSMAGGLSLGQAPQRPGLSSPGGFRGENRAAVMTNSPGF